MTRFRAALILLLVPAGASLAGTLTVDVRTTNDRGVVRCALFDSEKGFPMDTKIARGTATDDSIDSGRASCLFEGLEAGTYAVSVLHDENGDDKLQTGFLGIPKEPLGFSNGAKIRFGPPKWRDARFALSGTDATIVISAEPFRR